MATAYSNSTATTDPSITDHNIFNSIQNNESSSCPVLKYKGAAPWNNPDSLVSTHTVDFVNRVKYTVVLSVLFLIGGPANVINMAVFYKQGLRERINVCLFSLSLVDFLFLLCHIIYHAEQAFLQILTGFTIREKNGPLIRFLVNHNLLGFYGLPFISQIISAIIASERCFVVLRPLRSQTVLSSSTTTVIIVVTSIIILGLYSVMMTAFRVVCVHDPFSSLNVWTMVPSQFYLDNQKILSFLRAYVFGVGIPGVIIVLVIVTTTMTVLKLRQAAAWRAGTSSSSSVSGKEIGVTLMLVYNSVFFIVCVFPAALKRLARLLIPELGVGRQQHSLSILLNWVLDIVNYINATFNIIIYYTKGSRYRQTFWQLMGRGSKTAGHRNPSGTDAGSTAVTVTK